MAARRKIDRDTLPRRFPAFLTKPVREQWLAIARSVELMARWVPGRQGTGYEKLDLLSALSDNALDVHRRFVDSQISAARVSFGVDSSKGWDAYLLRYSAGAFVPEHRDPTTELPHLRLNALLLSAASGTGLFRLRGQVFDLSEGDAVLFRPDVLEHRVSRVEDERFVFSVGCVFLPDASRDTK